MIIYDHHDYDDHQRHHDYGDDQDIFTVNDQLERVSLAAQTVLCCHLVGRVKMFRRVIIVIIIMIMDMMIECGLCQTIR